MNSSSNVNRVAFFNRDLTDFDWMSEKPFENISNDGLIRCYLIFKLSENVTKEYKD